MCVDYERPRTLFVLDLPLCVFTVFVFFSSVLSLPVGGARGYAALYRTEGTFLHSICLSYPPHRVQTDVEDFDVEVSWNLTDVRDVTLHQGCFFNKGIKLLLCSSLLSLHKLFTDLEFVSYVNKMPKWAPFSTLTVQIYAAKQAYPTNAQVTFLAAAEDEHGPAEFLWHFGDSRSARTISKTITKTYSKPGRYDVVVVASTGRASVTSDVFPLVIQRAVKLNRLLHPASVPRNHTVTLSCRVTAGTNISFLWSFGDGSSRVGQRTEQHLYHRTGEFRVAVTVSNLVSSASLSSHIFVVDQPCQPPPVKNMGPSKLQVRRYEVVRLGVTYETEVDCESGGLHYTWTLFDSAGRVFPLTHIDTHMQTLTLPSHLLDYDTYAATARVQVIGSVVYSNYSVRVQVMPSPPLASIHGGTNIFINPRNTNMVSLDGQQSFDPDFPTNPLSFSWTCKPVSSITSSCFHQLVPTSSPMLSFPARFLKHNFDQFHFVLTVHSGERSSSSETFLTLTSKVIRKVFVQCLQCRGEQVNWDQSFTVSASCEGCDIAPKYIDYTWRLYLVNGSSKPVIEVPFCHTLDLSAPSAIMVAPDMSTFQRPVTEASQQSTAVSTSAFVSLSENVFERETSLESNGQKSSVAGPLDVDGSGVLHSDLISEFAIDPASSNIWEQLSFPVSENGGLGGRLGETKQLKFVKPRCVDGASLSPGDESVVDVVSHEEGGSNLVDSRPPVVIQEPILLDLARDLVDTGLFESYTSTAIYFSYFDANLTVFTLRSESQDSILGRTQLFLKTNPAPKGIMCQVQQSEGVELFTHFSIFCSSGREDLMYEYSIRVGDRPPRTLYQGRDFQYYFSLPSGDPGDDYKVTIHTEIRSSTYGTASKPCPVTVRVLPSFSRNASSSHLDPDLELSESGLRNLSALLQLGNSAEVRNYISLLSGILNRLSQDTNANAHAQRHTRDVLISTMCELESRGQTLIFVTVASVRRVTRHVQAISKEISEISSPARYSLDQETIYTLVTLLSYSLRAAIPNNDSATEMFNCDVAEPALESGLHKENIKNAAFPSNCRKPETSSGVKLKRRSISPRQAVQLVSDILETASDLMLVRNNMSSSTNELKFSTGHIALYATHQNQTSTVISSGSAAFHMPALLIQLLFAHHRGETEDRPHPPCVLAMLTELTHSPYTRAHYPPKLSGPVVDLSLYECRTRRKIPVRSLLQPIVVKLQQPPRKSSECEYILRRSQVNYHSFNITQEHLQRAIQLSVAFTPPLDKAFPVMLLFRMFERPTPSMHHLRWTHRGGSNPAQFTLPSSYVSAAGLGHLALLTADFGKAPRHKHVSEQVSYHLTVDSSLCLSWDGHKGAWTHRSCRTLQAETSTAVNCSCYQLQPLTVVQQQVQSSHDAADLNLFLSASSDLLVLGVLVLCVCLYIPGLVACNRADVTSEVNRRVHYLVDNSPCDPYLYAVTIYTGPCSAAHMSAKVYIVLKGENSVSQTREIDVPGCTLFRRNSQDTFILSAADSLGPVRGVHVWHDNSGPCPNWYLKHVEVSEVSRGRAEGRAWLFMGQCWLAVDKGDGRVERMLQVCTEGIGFAEMLRLKLCDYLTDHHIWISVHRCPCPNSFTHTQRLGVSLLLLLGYAAVNTAIISQMDYQLPFDLGFIDVSAVSVTTGILSVLAVLPAAAVVSLLFRLRKLELAPSGVHPSKGKETGKDCFEGEGGNVDQEPQGKTSVFLSESSRFHNTQRAGLVDRSQAVQTEKGPQGKGKEGSHHHTAWTSQSSGSHITDRPKVSRLRPVSRWCHYLAWTLCLLSWLSCLVLSLIGARQRARYLRLVRPPTPAELRKTRRKRRREALLHKTIRDLLICGSMLVLMLCITHSSSFTDHHRLRNAITKHRGHDIAFMSIQKHEDWWKWTQTSLLNLLYKNASVCMLIGEPILQKTEVSSSSYTFHSIVSLKKKKRGIPLHMCAIYPPFFNCLLLSCRFDAASKLKLLQSGGWVDRQTVAMKVQFTLFSPAPSLFTSVTMLTEQNSMGALQPSVKVHSVRMYGTPAAWDFVVMVCQMTAMVHRDLDEFLCLQCIRSLRGVTLFLLVMKCVTVLRVNRTLATCATLLACSLSNLFWPTISGLILMVALSGMGNLLFAQSSKSFISLAHSLQTLLCCHWGPRAVRGLHSSRSGFLYPALLYLSTVLWTALSRSKGLYLLVFQTYYFEEFESLLDELLFRLNALASSVHHTLPREAEDSPAISPIPTNMGAQVRKTSCAFKNVLLVKSLLFERCNSVTEPESAPLIRNGREETLEKYVSHWTKKTESHWLNNSQGTHTEMVVNVLVHKDPV
uniref:Polycystic kidney disease protein 1-like 1 n=1 Tax=Mola mola TaxID=94237 RepID=A0A3Q3VWE9_MOLML